MNDLLCKYIKSTLKVRKVHIDWYEIDGHNCEVCYSDTAESYNTYRISINIWRMIIFLNRKK